MKVHVKIPDWMWKPNIPTSRKIYLLLITAWIVGFILLWQFEVPDEIPRPMAVLQAFPELWRRNVLYDLAASYLLNVKALAISTIISLFLAYSSRFAVLKPMSQGVSLLRFLGLTGFGLLLVIYFGNGEGLKVAMLTIAITVFYSTGMIAEVNNEELLEMEDYAKTLRMGEWKILREVYIYGTLDRAFELLRQNAAMGWMMLTGVEGMVRTGGGIGIVILDGSRFNNLAIVYAAVLVVLLVGLLQDFGLDWLKYLACPYKLFEKKKV